jgi:hypothetical protein
MARVTLQDLPVRMSNHDQFMILGYLYGDFPAFMLSPYQFCLAMKAIAETFLLRDFLDETTEQFFKRVRCLPF